MKILFYQIRANPLSNDFRISYESGWSYTITAGLIKSMVGHGASVLFSFSPDMRAVKGLERGDVFLISDLHHAFTNFGPVYGVPMQLLGYLKALGVKIVGVLNESVFYRENEKFSDPNWFPRQKIISQIAPFLDAVITPDYYDYKKFINSGLRALYSPFAAPLVEVNLINKGNGRSVFLGSLYKSRSDFLISEDPKIPIDIKNMKVEKSRCDYLDEMTRKYEINESSGNDLFSAYDDLKINQYKMYVEAMFDYSCIVNLPSVFRGIPCRLLEGCSTGIPVLSELPRENFERKLVAQLGGNALFYDPQLRFQFQGQLEKALSLGRVVPAVAGSWCDLSVRGLNILKFLDGKEGQDIVDSYMS